MFVKSHKLLLGDLLGDDALTEAIVEATVDVLQVLGAAGAGSGSALGLGGPVELDGKGAVSKMLV